MDRLIEQIADYVVRDISWSEKTLETAALALTDTLACALMGRDPAEHLLGPIVPGTVVPKGSRVIGTDLFLDPLLASFNNGLLIRWLDYNDTWLAKEWGHPSDNFGSLLSMAEYKECSTGELLDAAIRAYEIQGQLAISNSLNAYGYDHVFFVKVASAATVTKLLGGSREQVAAAVSQAIVDLGPLRTYRHAPQTGPRKSWAAGDATARGAQLSWITLQGEAGYPEVLSAPKWGFNDTLFELHIENPLHSYVMDHILFKAKYPAEFHAQTAVEAAVQMHPDVVHRLDQIDKIEIETHESALRIIDKEGALHNFADRDHCMQYMVAVALLTGDLKESDYHPPTCEDPRIDLLRGKMQLIENPQFSRDYLDPHKRSITSSLVIYFQDGPPLGPLKIEAPVGHPERRAEVRPLIDQKFTSAYQQCFPDRDPVSLLEQLHSPSLFNLPVKELLTLLCM